MIWIGFCVCDIYRDSLGWAVVLNFLVYVTLPVPLKFTGVLLGIGSFATYITAIIGLAKRDVYFWEQVCFSHLLYPLYSLSEWILCIIGTHFHVASDYIQHYGKIIYYINLTYIFFRDYVQFFSKQRIRCCWQQLHLLASCVTFWAKPSNDEHFSRQNKVWKWKWWLRNSRPNK